MSSNKKTSQKKWILTEEQRTHLTEMIQAAGFVGADVIDNMIERIRTSKTDTAQSIMARWLDNRSENGMQKWMDDVLFRVRHTGLTRKNLIDVLSKNPMPFFSKPETLCENGRKLKENLRKSGIVLSDKVIFNPKMFGTGILGRSPDTIARNIENLIRIFEQRGVNLDYDVFIERVLKQRNQLLMQRDTTLASNIDRLAGILANAGYPITIQRYAKACSSQISLIYRNPKTISSHFNQAYKFLENEHCLLACDPKKDIKTQNTMVEKILSDPSQLGMGEDTWGLRWLLACQMKEKKGMVPSYTQVVKVATRTLPRRLAGYRCPLQRAVDKMKQRD